MKKFNQLAKKRKKMKILKIFLSSIKFKVSIKFPNYYYYFFFFFLGGGGIGLALKMLKTF